LKLALTRGLRGSLYLFKDEINYTVFAFRNVVSDPGTLSLAPSVLAAKATEAVPDSFVTSFVDPATRTSDDSGKRLVYINPYTGAELDTLRTDREPMWILKKIHSLELFGTFANQLIEAVGGFAIILVITGIYLWWPRAQSGGGVTLRGSPDRRIWWRDLHAVTVASLPS
jgi:uncharacterized iron-regulated membrane protein